MSHQNVVYKSQTTSFSAKASVTYTGKVGVLVKAFSLEYSHNTLVFHSSVCNNGVQDNLSVCIHIL